MSDIGFWLSKKYSIQQQQADTAGRLQNAQAAHTNAETGEVAANARASRTQAYGAADAAAGAGAASRAHAGLLAANAAQVPALAGAEVAQRRSAADLAGANADTARYDISPAHESALAGYGMRMGYRPANGQMFQPSASGAPSPYMRSVTSLPMDAAATAPPPAAPAAPASGGFDDGGVSGDSLAFRPYAVPHFASGTSSVGGALQQDGQPVGTPGYSANMQTHQITDRSTGQPMQFQPVAPPQQQVAGFAAGTSGFDGDGDGDGSQPNPSGAPPNAQGGTPAPAGVTGASSWGGVGMPAPKNLKKGTDKVSGKGSGKVDTQPAMLAPGEAVLNKAAAEHLGRDTIDLLNAAGAQKMGLDGGGEPAAPQSVATPQGKVPGHAKGTSDVSKPDATGGQAPAAQARPGHKAKAPAGETKGKDQPKDTPKADEKGAPVKGKPAAKKTAGITPEMITALAGMMRGGAPGGMPAPMGPPPAPQQMPPAQMPRQ